MVFKAMTIKSEFWKSYTDPNHHLYLQKPDASVSNELENCEIQPLFEKY
jgi:hypothetical protein